MIAQGRWHATSYALSLKDSSASVAIKGDHIVACDLAGRLYSVFHSSPDGRSQHYRRSLNALATLPDDERADLLRAIQTPGDVVAGAAEDPAATAAARLNIRWAAIRLALREKGILA